VRENIDEALERSGRDGDEVRVLVASKYYGPEQISALAEAGVDLVGENRAEDLVDKQELFGDRFEWHFIGHVQRRKAKVVVPRVSLIHSVDSVRLVEELAARAPEAGIEVLVQVQRRWGGVQIRGSRGRGRGDARGRRGDGGAGSWRGGS
jgi:uncharacterized pyridoxal phosphate-containing UPF0001 family protein